MLRVDQALVEKGLCESREKARRAVLAGQVRINDRVAAKASDTVRPNDNVELIAPEKFVSRGGYKLEHALATFQVQPAGWTAVDLGASTGGFTDCLLQHGAKQVFSVDVGHGQLAWKLRQDPRVVVMERTNARELTPMHFPWRLNFGRPGSGGLFVYIAAQNPSTPPLLCCVLRVESSHW